MTGQWQCELEEETIDYEIKIGAIIDAAFHLILLGFIYLDKGLSNDTQEIIEKLHKISSDFDDEGVKVIYYYLIALKNLKLLNLDEALLYVDKCISLSEKIGHRDRIISSIGIKSQIHIMRNDLGKAKALIDEALTLFSIEDLVAPYSKSSILMASFLYSIESLKGAGAPKHGKSINKLKLQAFKSGKAVIKNSKKVCSERTRGYLQMGEYYWQIGKQRKAFKWWKKSIQEGERLGARLDLSRTYFLVGKRLLEPESKHKKLNGIDAHGYLKKAQTLFEEMGLERDLDNLKKITASI